MAGRQESGVHPVEVERSGQKDCRIRVLPREVADQIAAGEVVERPASVIKELVENALDAGASHITIEIEAAGLALIAVVDDGEGMGPEDAVAAFLRHATSKVGNAADLECIATLGFRGEALASIAAVSRTTLVTRRDGDVSGTCVVIEYGKVIDKREVGTPVGSRIEVSDLFANTPARRKFLKTPPTETGHVTDLVTRTALAWPHVGFTLRQAGRTVAEFSAVVDHEQRIRQVFGAERAGEMVAFFDRGSAGYVYGWLTDPRRTFPSARQIYTYVNRRHVRDKLVTHSAVAGYSTLLMHGRYPGAVIFLEISPQEVDVNVHPAKVEVRFRQGGAVHELVSRAVQARLREQGHERPEPTSLPMATLAASQSSVPMIAHQGQLPQLSRPLRLVDEADVSEALRDWQQKAKAIERQEPQDSPSLDPLAISKRSAESASETGGSASGPAGVVGAYRTGFFSSLRVVGQVFDGYIVCEHENGLILIDQHAAHERVMFENLRAAYGKGSVPQQRMLIPIVVEVGAREAALIGERIAELERLGFEIESFGGTSFHVRAVPALLGDCDPVSLLRDVADEIAEVGRSRRLTQAADAVLARLACHSAVRFGQSMTLPQIRALLASMDSVDFSGHCPHGRPAFIQFPKSELERWFKRT